MSLSIGEDGKGVLVSRKSPREIFITKSGIDILDMHRGCHPFLDIIIANIKVVFGYKLFGIDSKLFSSRL